MKSDILKKVLNFVLDILFPKECLNCGKHSSFLCEECFLKININEVNFFSNDVIDEVHVSTTFHNRITQKLIHFFKYKYIEELAESLSNLMIYYYKNI